MMKISARRLSIALSVLVIGVWLMPEVGAGASASAASAQSEEKLGTVLERGGLLSTLSLKQDRGPVEITAKALAFDYRKLELTYEGDVKVTQGDMTLQSDRLTVFLEQGAAEAVRKVVAEGKVRITQGDRVATGGKAVFDQGSRTVTLSDGAVLRQGLNEVTGKEVEVYLDEERSVVRSDGEGRVRARLFPGDQGAAQRAERKTPGSGDGG
jgi:lipopolysaccharide export system protein LptA